MTEERKKCRPEMDSQRHEYLRITDRCIEHHRPVVWCLMERMEERAESASKFVESVISHDCREAVAREFGVFMDTLTNHFLWPEGAQTLRQRVVNVLAEHIARIRREGVR